MWSGKCKQHRHTKAGEKELYRLVHEGNLHAPQQPLASACISHPIQEANIPAGACYQQNPSNCTKNCLKVENSKNRQYITKRENQHRRITKFCFATLINHGWWSSKKPPTKLYYYVPNTDSSLRYKSVHP